MFMRSSRRPLIAALTALAAAGCDSPTSPDAFTPPDTQVLSFRSAFWTWLPGSQEILHTTNSLDESSVGVAAIMVPGGSVRTVVAAGQANGYRIPAQPLQVRGAHVYFVATGSDGASLYRALLTGGSAEPVLDRVPAGAAVSPDGRLIAWLDRTELPVRFATLELATGAMQRFPLADTGHMIQWSPTGRAVIVSMMGWRLQGTPFHWIDLQNGTVRLWHAPGNEVGADATRHFRWDGETPFLYTTGGGVIARYSLATGIRELLASAEGEAIGWSQDFETVHLANSTCRNPNPGFFGCMDWDNRVHRVGWRSGQSTEVLHHDGQKAFVGGQLSPDGKWLAYRCRESCYYEGVHLVRLP
jgi:hypothetical protein